MRGPAASQDPQAGPAREDAILRSCSDDKWPTAMLACVGTSKTPNECLAKLNDAQRDSLNAKLGTWDAQYATDPDGEEGGVAGGDEKYVDCAELTDDVSRWQPPIKDEKDWQTIARKKLIETTCNAEGWEEKTKECIQAPANQPATCLADSPTQIAKQLTELDATATKIATARKKPISCAKAVAIHYSDASWKKRGPKVNKPEIAASRTEMTKQCTAEAWTEAQRACIVVDDDPRCYSSPQRWGYPALILPPAKDMPAECALYKAAMDRISTCAALPETSRTAMRDAFGEAAKMWIGISADDAKAVAPICAQGTEAMLGAFPECGGWVK